MRFRSSRSHGKVSVIVTLLATAGAVATPADAADDKSFHGTSCTSIYPADDFYGTGIYQETSGIRNGSTGWRYIQCPIVRDNTVNVNGAADVEAAVSDNSGQMWCYAMSLDRFGSAVDSAFLSIPSPGTNRVLDFALNLNQSINRGTYVIQCAFPPGAYLHSYYINEN